MIKCSNVMNYESTKKGRTKIECNKTESRISSSFLLSKSVLFTSSDEKFTESVAIKIKLQYIAIWHLISFGLFPSGVTQFIRRRFH